MSHTLVKAAARRLGMYRAARWVHRHLMNRAELRAFHDDLRFYAALIEPGALCFDVGANYGSKTELFLCLGAKVVAFEPQTSCIDEMKARLGPNPNVVAVNAAVGTNAGCMTLYIRTHTTCSSLIKNWDGEPAGTAEVPVTTLDDAIATFGSPQYCKIDVEGFELEVLRGLTTPIPVISYEYHLAGGGASRALEALDYLSKFGELQANVTPAEKLAFATADWWDKAGFTKFFTEELPRLPEYHYGDIFVRFKDRPVTATKTASS